MNQINSTVLQKERLWLPLLAIATSVFAAIFLSVGVARAGNGVSASINQLDRNANGKINRITFSVDNDSAHTWAINGTLPNGISVTRSGNGVTVSAISFTTATNADPIGLQVDLNESDTDLTAATDVTALELIYTQVTGDQTCTNCIKDGTDNELNAIATGDTGGTDTEADGAAPAIYKFGYVDNDNDGKIDRLKAYFSETVTAGSTMSKSDLLITNVGDFTAAAFGGNTDDLLTAPVASVNIDLGTESSAVDTAEGSGTIAISSQNSFSLTDGTNTNSTTGAMSHLTFSDEASPVLTSVVLSNTGTYNAVAFGYSEAITLSGGATSSADYGDMKTTPGSVLGFGGFSVGDLRSSATTNNSLSGSGTSTITITFNSNGFGAHFDNGSVALSGNVTPLASVNVLDAASNQVNTSSAVVASTGGSWDVTKPTITSGTVSDADHNGKIETATIVFSSALRVNSIASADGALSSTAGTTTGAFNAVSNPTIVFTRTNETGVATDTDVGSETDFTYTGATTKLCDPAGNLVDTGSDGTIVTGDITEIDGANPVVVSVTKSVSSNLNRLSIVYSETVNVTNGASTTTSGDMTTVGVIAGFGSFATTGNATVNSLKNTVGGDNSSTITIDLAGQTGGTITVTASPGTELDGAFTPVASDALLDDASNQAATTATSDTVEGAAWDLTRPTLTSVTINDASNNNGKIDYAALIFNSNMRDSSFTAANGSFYDGADSDTTAWSTTVGADADANDDRVAFTASNDLSSDINVDTSAEGVDFLYSGSTTKMTDLAGNLVDLTTDGVLVDDDKTQTDGASPILRTVVFNKNGNYNSLEFGYSENMALANGAASTADRGALVSEGTISGIADFATNGTILVDAATYNTITISTSTVRVTFANQTNGYWTSVATPTIMSGNVTPLSYADITDGTNTVNTSGAVVSPTTTTSWDITQPTVSSITFSDAAGTNGKIDRATVVFSENIDDTYILDAPAALSSTAGTTTGTFTSGTADDTTTAFNRGADDAAVDTDAGTESNFTYTATGATNYIRDLAGNLLDATVDGSIAGEVVETDNAAPIMSAASTLDDDSDGKVDMIVATWTEAVDDSSFDNTQDTLATLTLSGTLATPTSVVDTADDATTYIGITEGSYNTSATDTYTALATLIDDMAAAVPSAADTQSVTDGAKPAITAITTSDSDKDGTVDRLTVSFSEAVDITDNDATGFDGFDGLTNSCVIDTGTDLSANSATSKQFTVGSCASGTGITVELLYNSGDANTNIQDEAVSPNEMKDNETVTGTDGAAPVMTSATYLETGTANGTVDTIRTTWSENVTMASAGANDFSVTNGSITLAFSSAADDAVAGTTLDVTVTADTNETGGAIAPTITYIPGNGDPIVDTASSPNSATANGAVTVNDAAGPVIISGTYADSDGGGKIDKITLVYTEAVDFTYAAADWAFTVAGGVNLAADFDPGDCTTGLAVIVCTDANNSAMTSDDSETGVNGGTEPTWTYTNNSNNVNDQAAANTASATESQALVDGAAPVTLMRTYTDNGANGSVDRLLTTYTEYVTWNGSDLSQFAVVAQDLTGFEGAPSAVSGSGTATLTMTVAATTNITGATTAPTVAYTQSGTTANRVQDSSGNYLATYTAANISDAAAPIILSGTYRSVGADGEVDTYTMTTTTDTGLACTAFTGNTNVSVGTAGTVTLAVAAGDTCADNNTNLFTISLATDGVSNTTGGVTDPVITYTQPGNGLEDGAGNDVPTKTSLTLTDAAVPVVLSGKYEDSLTVDGEIDRVVFTTSADVGLSCDGFVGGTTFTVGTAGTVAVASAAGDTCSTNGTSTVTVSLATQGATDTTGGAVNPIVTLDNPVNGIEDGQGNDLVDSTSLTITDGAKPFMTSVTYADNNADGLVDKVTSVFSENTTFTMAGADWSFSTAGSITATGDFAAAECTGSGTATIVCLDAGTGTFSADANETGGTTQPVWTYTNNSNNVTDGTNHTAGFVKTLTDGARPILISASPASGGQLIPATADFTLTFSEDLLDGSVTTSNIVVTASSGTPTYTVADSSGTVTVTTTGATFSTGVTATVTVGTGVTDSSSNTYNTAGTVATEPYSFTTLNPSSGGGGGGGGASTVSVVSDAVAVTAPNGGEQLTGGAGYTITWTSTGNVNNVMLYYSVDGGTNFGLIAAGTDDDGSYSWTVPNTATSQARIKIVGRDAGGATLATDLSNSNFIISTNVSLPIADAPVGTGDITTTPDGYMGRTEAEASLPETIDVDYLVRAPDDGDPTTDYDTTVYYIGLDAKRHPFPNSQVYFTWYENFDSVRTISADTLSQMSLGAPVLTRPGTLMVKIQSDPRTFAVEPGDYTIRWVPTEEVAVALYGSNWNKRIMDIEPTYFTRFTMGSDLTANLHPAGSVLQSAAGGSKYYYDGTNRREFASDGAFTANMFQTKYVITAPTSTGWLDATLGAAITGFEDALFSLQR